MCVGVYVCVKQVSTFGMFCKGENIKCVINCVCLIECYLEY